MKKTLTLTFLLWGCVFTSFISAQIQFQIGAGEKVTSTVDPSPVNIHYESLRLQLVYSKAELNAVGAYGGIIRKLGFFVVDPPSKAMPNYTIKVKETSAQYPGDNEDEGLEEVYFNGSYMPSGNSSDLLTLDNPYFWSGEKNLLIEVCFGIVDGYVSSGTVKYDNADNVMRYVRDDNSNICGNSTNSTINIKPQLFLEFEPAANEDAGIQSLLSPNIFCSGSNEIIIAIGNYGKNDITEVDINWEFNGEAQPPIVYSEGINNLESGNNIAEVSLGNKVFENGENYNLLFWTSNPNNTSDENVFNDTLEVTIGPGMTGTYTIGGVNPDYQSIGECVAQLNEFGVCGDVILNIRDGVYNEQIELQDIKGVSQSSQITMQSESGNAADVIISYSNDYQNNYIIKLNKTNWINFKNLSFEATSTSYGRILVLENEASHILIEKNILKGINNEIVYAFSNQVNQDVRVLENTFIAGSTGIYMSGLSDNPSSGVVIEDNIFRNQRSYGVYLQYVDSPQIKKNSLTTNSANYYIGLYLNYCTNNLDLSANRIYNIHYGSGIYLNDITGTEEDNAIIANNFVQLIGQNESQGIFSNYGTNQIIIYNSVNILNTHTNTRAFQNHYGDNKIIINNIFSNKGGGYAIYIDGAGGSTQQDYNDLFVIGEYLGYYNNQSFESIDDWVQFSLLDSNSISEPPLFTSDTSIQVVQISLNGAAIPNEAVIVDFEGDIRDVTNPDIGADEFLPPTLDAGLISIKPAVFPFEEGQQELIVELKNFGVDLIQNTTIEWMVEGVQQEDVAWSGSLSSEATEEVSLGTVNFDLGIPRNIVAWSSKPNNEDDLIGVNDTIRIDSLYAGLGGEYTIGGTNPDFIGFRKAVQVLNNGGIYNDVVFKARSGSYNEQFIIGDYASSDSLYNVTFTSDSSDSSLVTIFYNNSVYNENYVVRIDDSRNLKFSNLSFASDDNYYSRIIEFMGDNEDIYFESSVIKSNRTNQDLIFSSYETQLNNFKVQNCFLQGGYRALNIQGQSNNTNASFTFENNIFQNQSNHGIYIYYVNETLINNNTFTTRNNSSNYYAIYCDNTRNKTKILNNRIFNILNGNGIYISNTSENDESASLIANNFINIKGTNQNYGINSHYGTFQNIIYNTINISNTNSESRAIFIYSGSEKKLLNNIFSNEGGGYAIHFTGNNTISIADYNDIYSSGEYLIKLNENNIPKLIDWQLNTGFDLNSQNEDPIFLVDSSYQITQISLNGKAQPTELITTDIEGNPRDLENPDIGAYEFLPPSTDAGLTLIGPRNFPFVAEKQDIWVNLKNYGTDPLAEVRINWISDGSIKQYDWNGSLLSNDTISFVIDSFDFILGEPYDLISWTSMPNGAADPISVNDTIKNLNLYAGLWGEYTIGGADPDFENITNAVNTLNNGGVVGPVNFNIRDGVYNEQISIEDYPGTDSLKVVHFVSESADSTSVTISFESGYSNNYILRLDGAKWLVFENIAIEASNNYYGRLIEIINNSKHNVFKNNWLKGIITTNTTIEQCLVYSTAQEINEYNAFLNNRFSNGSYGIYFDGNYNNYKGSSGLICKNNIFEDQYYHSIYIDQQNRPLIHGNIIRSANSHIDSKGIYAGFSYLGGEISSNQISNVTGDGGIYLNNCSGIDNSPFLVSNNFIYVKGLETRAATGIYSGSGDYQWIVFNSVNITNEHPDSKAFHNYFGRFKRVLNNIFVNDGGGYAYYNSTNTFNPSIDVSDHNNIFTTGEKFAYWNEDIPDFETWKIASMQDSNSVVVVPDFVSERDLHTTKVTLDKAGIALANISVDIDGDARDPIRPDIGADEFSTSQNDVAVISIDSPAKPFAATLQPIFISILNNGLDTLETVNIDWEVNGQLQIPLVFNEVLFSGKSKDSVNIGSYTFELDTAYKIKVWVSQPNGMSDADHFNDTTVVDSLYAGLGGIYTIGGENPDFVDFNSSVRALSRGGVVSDVTFAIRSGTYNEQFKIPEIIGASSERNITFASESNDSTSVLIKYIPTNEENYLVLLDGASWFRFEKIGFKTEAENIGRVIELRNNAHHNVFSNSVFEGIKETSNSSNFAIIYSGNSNDNFNEFRHNIFNQGAYALYLRGNAFTDPESGNIIEGNKLNGQGHHGIDIQNQNDVTIENNEILNSLNNNNYVALNAYQCSNNTKVIRNNLHDLFRGRGLYFTSCSADPGSEILVANNFIQVGNEANEGYGMELNSSSNVNVYHNNVNITSTNQNSFAFRSNFSNGAKILNNVFVNSGGGRVYDKNNGAINVSNFNVLFTEGEVLGNWDGSNTDDINEWRASSTLDGNSISIDPIFNSPNDLHVSEVDLNGSAFPLAVINVDIDGELRNSNFPDRGADEFSPIVTNDAGIAAISQPSLDIPFPDGELGIYAVIKNNGSDTLYSVVVQWKINNNTKPAINWEGSLFPGARDTVLLGSFDFRVGVNHSILAYSESPDGMADGDTSNDTLFVTGLYPGLIGAYTVGGQQPDFDSFEEAALAINNGGILGAVTFNIRDGIYEEQISLSKIKGVSPSNTITIQSESLSTNNVTLSYGSNTRNDNYIIRIDETDYVIIRHLTFLTGHRDYATAIELINGSDHNLITDNIFKAEINTTDALLRSNAISLDESNTIANNQFTNGGYGVLVQGQGNSLLEKGTEISENIFLNQRYAAIYATNQESISISENTIQTDGDYYNYFGIRCAFCDGDFQIIKNKILGSKGHGIWLDRCDSEVNNKGLIANNFIQVGGDQLSYGIYTYYGSNFNIYYNSVHVNSTNPNSSVFGNYYGLNKNVINNIFYNSGGGFAYNSYSSSGIAISDYNNLFITGTQLGKWNNNIAPTLSEWKSISGKDDNSNAVDPLFTSISDLHCFQPLLDSTGIALSEVVDDIDGELRSVSKPDVGADEFDYVFDDVGIIAILSPESGCDLGSESITVVVQNFSGLTLSGFNVAYQINGRQPVVENIGNTPINPGTSMEYTFIVTADLSEEGIYDLRAFTLLPDDTNINNDSTILEVESIDAPALVNNMIPVDGTSGLSTSIAFSWNTEETNAVFDLYIWLDGQERPEMPSVSNIPTISYLYTNSSLLFGDLYNWQIITRNQYCSAEGPVQTFRLFDLPDLVVQNVQAPTETFSGREINISWDVENLGEGSTGMTNWTDAIYLSQDLILDLSIDRYLTGVQNISALEPGQSYSNTTSLLLPDGINDSYYFFVWSDRYNYSRETDNDNNIGRSNQTTITLTPPPDLQITSVLAPNNAFSGMPIDVRWEVKNDGNGNTRSAGWVDRIYLNEGPDLDLATAVQLGQLAYSEVLMADSSYTLSLTADLPDGISGTYFIIVETDIFNQEFEFANESNNIRKSNPINIVLTPPPDIVVSSVLAPLTATNHEIVNIEFEVSNQGGSSSNGIWYDQIYLSSDPDSLVIDDALILFTLVRAMDLNPGEHYIRNVDLSIPDKINGSYYVYVHTDYDDRLFEYTFNDNNIGRTVNPITVSSPDLVVEDIITPSSAMSGDSIEIQWKLRNVGNGSIQNTHIKQNFYVTNQMSLDTASAVKITGLDSEITVPAGSYAAFSNIISLPNGIAGSYKILIFADADNTVFEIEEDNNINIGDPIEVQLAPWIDFYPISLSIPSEVAAGALIDAIYQVRNIGSKATKGESWIDKFYLSSSPIWSAEQAQQIRFDEISKDLEIDSSYTENKKLSIPLNLKTGNYYIHLFTDAENEVYEHQSEHNNIYSSPAIFITGYPAVDLVVDNVNVTGSLFSGEPVEVSWNVRNRDVNTTISGGWLDAIYISTDTLIDDQDIFIDHYTYNGTLEMDDGYNASILFQLPNGLSGEYYILVINDYSRINNDYNRSNNIGFKRDDLGQAQPSVIQLSPPPDLIISSLNVPVSAFAGQPINVEWIVKNIGQATTKNAQWTDRIYLSDDLILNPQDRILASISHEGLLGVEEAYTQLAEVTIPVNFIGNKILIVKTDVNNVEYEFDKESNNIASTNINIIQPPPSDLVVISATVPGSALAGENVLIEWTVKNIGENPAIGWMKEAIYLSVDQVWDAQDILLGSVREYINLAPQVSINHQQMVDLDGVAVGDYYVIVRTDILNNFGESNEVNNDAPSTNTINIDVPELFIGLLETAQLTNGDALYYRIEIPSGLNDETLLITLKGDSIAGNNEVYLSLNTIPSRSSFDFTFDQSFSGNQEIVVPELNQGTYYLLVTGSTMMSNSQDISLLAEILDFEVRRVHENRGGNGGTITIEVEGSKFEPGMQLSLQKQNVTIGADAIVYVDRTKVFASFNLINQQMGKYDMVATKANGETARLNSAFEIILGQPPSLATNILRPASSRPGNIIIVQIEYENNGNVDLKNPIVKFTSLAGAPIAFTQDGLSESKTSLELHLTELNGPIGILRPGALGTITIYARATAQPAFMILIPDLEFGNLENN